MEFWSHLNEAGFFLADFSSRRLHASVLLRRLGYTDIQDFESGFAGHVHPDDEPAFRVQWNRLSDGLQDVFHAEFRIRDLIFGDWRWVLTHGSALKRDRGQLTVYAGVDLDITARKSSEELVREQLYETETIFHQAESLRVASLLANSTPRPEQTIELVLTHAQGLLRFGSAVVSRFTDGSLRVLGSQGAPVPETAAPRPHHPVWTVVASRGPLLKNDENQGSWLGIPLIFQGQFLGVIEFWHDEPHAFQPEQIWPAIGFADSIAESLYNAKAYEALQTDLRTDALTGLLTRRSLQDTGPMVVETCLRENKPFAVLFIDIDHFKEINDRHGHMVGDAVLMTIAQLCRTLLRKDDLFFRYGGEEFVALLPDTDGELTGNIAERLRETAADARFRGLEQGVTLSIGVVPIAAGQRVPFEQLLQEADQAMYRAKEAGRDRISTSRRWMAAAVDF